MKLLITGGHLTPALGVLQNLPKNVEVLYVGRKFALEGDNALSLEYQTITKMGIPFAELITGRIQRKLTKHTLASLLKIPAGFYDALKILKSYQPDVILGFGGYVSVPICAIGSLLKIPVVIHEQTLSAGIANKMLSKLADKICISWKQSEKFFPKNKTVLTGNPSSSEVFKYLTKKRVKSQNPQILIVGGSLGSHAINIAIEKCLESLLNTYSILHQTGDAKEYNDFMYLEHKKNSLTQEKKNRYTLVKFIDPKDILQKFQQADLVVSRAGINTVTALLILNKPALLIPLALKKNSEQEENALFFKNHGLGEVIDQKDLTPDSLTSTIHAMIEKKDKYTNILGKQELTIHKDAAKHVIEILISCVKNKSRTEKQNGN